MSGMHKLNQQQRGDNQFGENHRSKWRIDLFHNGSQIKNSFVLMPISLSSLATTSKFQKNICFKTRAVGLISINTKEVALYENDQYFVPRCELLVRILLLFQSINRLMYPIAGINLNYRKGQRQQTYLALVFNSNKIIKTSCAA